MAQYIAVETDEGRSCHAVEVSGNYATLCGISCDDNEENGRQRDLMIGERIDCDTCIAIIRLCKTYRENDFCETKRIHHSTKRDNAP